MRTVSAVNMLENIFFFDTDGAQDADFLCPLFCTEIG